MKLPARTLLLLALAAAALSAVSRFDLLSTRPTAADFPLATPTALSDLWVDAAEWECNRKGAEDLAHDIEMVTGRRPRIIHSLEGASRNIVLIGTLGRSPLIDRLAARRQFAADRIRGKWEGSLVQLVERPLPGIERALVLAGSDRRGTKYAIYEVSDNIGVSPYFKLNNVLPARRQSLFLKAGTLAVESSFVKYRGSFADDNRASAGVYMEPDETGRLYGGWASKRGGWTTANYIAYGEWDGLIRSKSNTYFPCEGLYTNIPFNNLPDGNDVLINQYGLVRSGGHLLSMLTTWVNEFPQWLKSRGYDPAEPFYYQANHARVVEFWQHSIDRNRGYEVLWPIGLRGRGDQDYSEPGVSEPAALVRQATIEQARMLARTPGLASRDMIITGWRGDYGVVDQGLVPAGATYAFSDGALPGAVWYDDVPLVTDEQRAKNPGATWGAYFHNSIRMGSIQRVARDQTPGLAKLNREFTMLLDRGMTRAWEINNGPYKGMQYANEYIAALGRNPDYWRDPLKITEFLYRVMRRDFGPRHARAIAGIYLHMDTLNLINYGTYRRGRFGIGVVDPEFFPDPYSILNFGDEYGRAIADLDSDLQRAVAIQAELEPQQRDGFFESILWPLKLHLAAMRQHYYGYKATLAAKQGRRGAQSFLSEMEKAAAAVVGIALDYQTVHGGFWQGWTQDDPREWPRLEEIWGYNSNPAGEWYHEEASRYGRYTLTEMHTKLAKLVESLSFAPVPALDVNTEGAGAMDRLPVLSVFGDTRRFIDLGNRGHGTLHWKATASRPWIRVEPSSGEIEAADARLWVSADWRRVPQSDQDSTATVTIDAGPAGRRTLEFCINNPRSLRPETVAGHVEVGGYLAIGAGHYTKKVDRAGAAWRLTRISFARDGYSMCAYPMTRGFDNPAEAPSLIYRLNFQNAGNYYLNFSIFDRTLFKNFYYSLDGAAPVLVDSNYPRFARDAHARNLRVRIVRPGVHSLEVFMRDPGVVLDRITFTREPADFGNFPIFEPVRDSHPAYRAAAPPESYFRARTSGKAGELQVRMHDP